LLGELAGPQRDVVPSCGEWVQVAGGAPGVPGLQIGEVRAACLRAAALDEERGDQAPERVLVELGHAELAARQPSDRGRRQRRRRRHAEDVALRDLGHEHARRAGRRNRSTPPPFAARE
jgi:hypothetical protein